MVTVIAVILVDKAGRRILLLASTVLTSVGMAGLGAYFYLDENDPQVAGSISWLPLVSMIVFITGFAIGLGPIPWLMTSEILPRRIKGREFQHFNNLNCFKKKIINKKKKKKKYIYIYIYI